MKRIIRRVIATAALSIALFPGVGAGVAAASPFVEVSGVRVYAPTTDDLAVAIQDLGATSTGERILADFIEHSSAGETTLREVSLAVAVDAASQVPPVGQAAPTSRWVIGLTTTQLLVMDHYTQANAIALSLVGLAPGVGVTSPNFLVEQGDASEDGSMVVTGTTASGSTPVTQVAPSEGLASTKCGIAYSSDCNNTKNLAENLDPICRQAVTYVPDPGISDELQRGSCEGGLALGILLFHRECLQIIDNCESAGTSPGNSPSQFNITSTSCTSAIFCTLSALGSNDAASTGSNQVLVWYRPIPGGSKLYLSSNYFAPTKVTQVGPYQVWELSNVPFFAPSGAECATSVFFSADFAWADGGRNVDSITTAKVASTSC